MNGTSKIKRVYISCIFNAMKENVEKQGRLFLLIKPLCIELVACFCSFL